MLSQCMEQGNETCARLDGSGMLRSKHLLSNGQGTSVPDTSCFILALRFPKTCKAIYGFRRVRMLRPQLLLSNVQHSLEERLRFRILALLTVEERQVVERGGYIGMLWSQLLLKDTQHPQIERLRFRILALLIVEDRQVVERGSHLRMVWSQLLLSDVQGPLEERLRFGVARTTPEVGRSLVEQTPCFLTNDLIRLDVLSDQQGMWQQALTLRPVIILRLWKRCVDRQHCLLSPLPLGLGWQGVADHRLHQSVDCEGVRVRVTRHQRVGAQGGDRFVQGQRIACHHLQLKAQMLISLGDYLFRDRVGIQECT